ncbi:MAG: N-acetylmuramoyl-L-alanine amidase family protein, partial [Phycisphaerae bacterium]
MARTRQPRRRGVTRAVLSLLPVLLAALASAGCDGNNHLAAGGEIVAAPLETISTYQLAGRLGLTVTQSARTTATLSNPANTVVLYADPGGQVFVNSRAFDAPGIVGVGNILFVPERLVEPIRATLRPVPRPVRQAPSPAPEPETPRRTVGTVVLDAGHGGRDPGAIAVTGMHEKTVNLAVARRTAELLRGRGVEVLMTRTDDTFVELDARADVANNAHADLFVSIHADSAENPSASGFTTYVARAASRDSHAAAGSILAQLGRLPASDRGLRQADYRVLVRTSCPAVLVELGYLSNIGEARRLAEPAYRERLARALADGIVQHLR